MSPDQDRIDKALSSIEELKNKSADKPKDSWDKAAVVGQLISGIVIAIVGYFVTVSLDHGQASNAKAIADAQTQNSKAIADEQVESSAALQRLQNQLTKTNAENQLKYQELAHDAGLDATNRQIVGAYFGNLVSAKPEARAEFIDALDVELGPAYSIPLAVRLTRPISIRDEICNAKLVPSVETQKAQQESLVLARKASDLLERLKDKGRQQLQQISDAKFQPDAGIADHFLGRGPNVQYRVSDIDDYVDVVLNNEALGTYAFGKESGWKTVPKNKLRYGKNNDFAVIVRNTPYEGTGVRLEMRIGAYQYERAIRRNDWTGEGPAFFIGVSIPVNDRGEARFNGDNVQTMGPIGQAHCEAVAKLP